MKMMMVLVGVAVICGCAAPTRYRVQVAGNAEVVRTQSCVASCEELHHNQGDFFTCVQKCPGVETSEGFCAQVDKLPEAVCSEDDLRPMLSALTHADPKAATPLSPSTGPAAPTGGPSPGSSR